jgi:hypothetical protein
MRRSMRYSQLYRLILKVFPRMIAFFAINFALFALAQKMALDHTDPAFQASSPKTSRPGRQRSGLFSEPRVSPASAASRDRPDPRPFVIALCNS